MKSALEFAEWPIERSELVDFVDVLLEHAPATFAETCQSDTLAGRCLVNLSCRLLQDILGFLGCEAGTAIKQPCQTYRYGKCTRIFTKYHGIWFARKFDYDQITALQPQPSVHFKKLARIFKERIVRDGFLRRPMTMIDITEDIVSVSSQPLIIQALARTNRSVNLEPVHGWFPRIAHAKVGDIRRREDFSGVIELIIDFTFICASRMDVALQRAEIDVLIRYLSEAMALVGAYTLQLEQRSRPIPFRLWSGSSGIIWIRMLQEAVLRRGGHVTGYDHAEGADFDEGCKFGFVELQTVNTFVTFNQYIAGNFQRAAHKFNFTGLEPEVEFYQKNSMVGQVKKPPQNRRRFRRSYFCHLTSARLRLVFIQC